MKYLILSLILISTSTASAIRGNGLKEMSTNSLVCAVDDNEYTESSASCVSKASIEKDKAELELIKLQIEALKNQKSNVKDLGTYQLNKPYLKKDQANKNK